jgi:hypothetical protein
MFQFTNQRFAQNVFQIVDASGSGTNQNGCTLRAVLNLLRRGKNDGFCIDFQKLNVSL